MNGANFEANRARPRTNRLRLECLSGEAACEMLHDGRVQHGLGEQPFLSLAPGDLTAADYVSLAVDPEDGRLAGLVAASRHASAKEEFVLVDPVALQALRPSVTLMRRLMAMIVLRMAGMEAVPAALAARVRNHEAATAFRALARQFTGAAFYPSEAGSPIELASARLAKRIAAVVAPCVRYDIATSSLRSARMAQTPVESRSGSYDSSTALDLSAPPPAKAYEELLVIIDLRSIEETALLDDARRAYRR